MAAPLAAISRHSVAVRLYDRFSAVGQAEVPTSLPFGRAEEAEAYLRHWLPDAAAIMTLRIALHRCEQSVGVASLADQEVLRILAGKLATGELLISETEPAQAGGGWPLSPATPAPVPESTVLVNLDAIPVTAPPAPVLPALEELQIEGAEVLPEIDQTLEQIDMTMGTIDLAGVSLAPTPSKVPQIETAMTDAAGSVTKTLGEL
jgi:hypothetical protein